jgi:hypothetical protein
MGFTSLPCREEDLVLALLSSLWASMNVQVFSPKLVMQIFVVALITAFRSGHAINTHILYVDCATSIFCSQSGHGKPKAEMEFSPAQNLSARPIKVYVHEWVRVAAFGLYYSRCHVIIELTEWSLDNPE